MGPESPICVPYPPLDPSQLEVLQNLRDALDHDDHKAIDKAFHYACYVLYAHERHQYPISEHLDKFFSPVNLFLVYASFCENGNFEAASMITGTCSALEYSIRSVMLLEIDFIAKEQHMSTFQYVIYLFI